MDPLRNPPRLQSTYSLREAVEEFDLFERIEIAETESEEEEEESEDE